MPFSYFYFWILGFFKFSRPARRGLVRTWRLSLGLGCNDFNILLYLADKKSYIGLIFLAHF